MQSLLRQPQHDVRLSQADVGVIDDYSDLPPVSGSAQRRGGQRPYPSGLCDDGHSPSLPAQV